MTASQIVLLAIAILVIIIVASGVKVVHQGFVAVIERLGRYHKRLDPGIHIIVPFLDSVAERIDMRERVQDFPEIGAITRDNAGLTIDYVVFFRVIDPVKYRYEIANPISAIQNLTATTLRNILGVHDLDSILNSRETMNAALTETLDRASDSWGMKVMRVELKAITPPKEVQDAMERQLRAERIKREQILQSEGEQQAAINQATGSRQAQILRAEGEAQAIETLAKAQAEAIRIVLEAYKQANANDRMLALKYLDSLEKMSEGEATKILLPYEATAMLGALAGLGEVFGHGRDGSGEAAAAGA